MDSKNLEKIHEKFKWEKQCPACGGYFLSKEPATMCSRCKRDGRVNPLEHTPEKDILHKDVNVIELSKKVAELESIIERLTKTTMEEIPRKNPSKTYKPKKCTKCDEEFTPGAAAQRICHDCRQELIS